jgi:hypothetical protein
MPPLAARRPPRQIPPWEEETGVSLWLKALPNTWSVRVLESPAPGVAIVRKPLGNASCPDDGRPPARSTAAAMRAALANQTVPN